METFVIVSQMITIIIGLIRAAEDLFKEPKSGPQKKDSVMLVINTIINGLIISSTGGQKETWSKIKMVIMPIISFLVDGLAVLLFPVHTD